jgi:hypothetical protein
MPVKQGSAQPCTCGKPLSGKAKDALSTDRVSLIYYY